MINVLGLALGFTAFILISLFIRYELNWDKSNLEYANIYRIQRHYSKTMFAMNGNDISPHSRAITAQLIENRFPEIRKVTVIREIDRVFMAYDPARQVYNTKGIFATFIASPSAWLVFEKIPSANKLHVQPWVFILGAGIVFVIIFLTTSYQTMKAALQNPVEALRYE
ncbi:MAG: ABC transporter permease [Bacteroidales bacterium]|nr:ABC transporter permease [Bacteroidales bacterium]MBK8883208.1 ABC transporter permease [Bacteroidales bacterium]